MKITQRAVNAMGASMEWNQIERKWAAMTRRVRNDFATVQANLPPKTTGREGPAQVAFDEQPAKPHDPTQRVQAR